MDYKLKYFKNTRLVKLTLGEEYTIFMWGKPVGLCRFIQPTEKGFNFLNLETSKCIMKHHIYPLKKYGDNDTFNLWKNILFMKIINNTKTA